jgi:hypothetical protein
VEFIVTQLPSDAILVDVGVRDGSQCARTEAVTKRRVHDLDMILGQHLSDYTQ